MKKIVVFIVLLISAIGILSYLYFSILNTEKKSNNLALRVATQNSALVFHYINDKSFYQITESQELIQKIIGFNKKEVLSDLKRNLIDNQDIDVILKDQPIYIAIYPEQNKEPNFVFSTETLKEINADQILQALNKNISSSEKIDNYLKINFSDSATIYLNIEKKVLSASTSLSLLKNVLKNLKENEFEKYIIENNKTQRNVLASAFINFNNVPVILKSILKTNLDGSLSFLNKQNSFASFNYNFSKERLLFNGLTKLNTNTDHLLTFENSTPQSNTIQNILPNNTANYTSYSFDSYVNWNKELLNWLDKNKELEARKRNLLKIKEASRVDLDQIFPVFSSNEFGVFQLNTGEKLAAIKLLNGNKVEQLLLETTTAYNDKIRRLNFNNVIYNFYGLPMKEFVKPFYLIKDNFLIISNFASTLEVYLNNYNNNKTLIQSESYMNAKDQISNTSNVTYYINFDKSKNIFKRNVVNEHYPYLVADSGLNFFDNFIYQMSADKGKFNTNILMNKYVENLPDSIP